MTVDNTTNDDNNNNNEIAETDNNVIMIILYIKRDKQINEHIYVEYIASGSV